MWFPGVSEKDKSYHKQRNDLPAARCRSCRSCRSRRSSCQQGNEWLLRDSCHETNWGSNAGLLYVPGGGGGGCSGGLGSYGWSKTATSSSITHSLIHAKTASICFISAQLRDGERENGISKKRQQQQEYEEEAREEDQSSPTEWGLRKHGFVTLSVVLRPLSVVDFHFVFRSYMYIIFTHLGINEYRTE